MLIFLYITNINQNNNILEIRKPLLIIVTLLIIERKEYFSQDKLPLSGVTLFIIYLDSIASILGLSNGTLNILVPQGATKLENGGPKKDENCCRS